MTWARWNVILVAVCFAGACSSGSSNAKDTSTTKSSVPAITGTVAANAWRDVAQGTFRAKAWKVAEAQSSTKWRCYDPQGSAAPAAGDTSSKAAAGPTRDGRATRCLAPASAHPEIPFTAFVNGSDSNQWVVVGAVADGVKKVSVVFADKTATPLNIDPKSRLVIWKGPASVHPKQIRTDATTCSIDPTQSAALCDGVAPAK